MPSPEFIGHLYVAVSFAMFLCACVIVVYTLEPIRVLFSRKTEIAAFVAVVCFSIAAFVLGFPFASMIWEYLCLHLS